MDIVVSDNHLNINNSIVKILTKYLITGFHHISTSQDLWDYEKFYDKTYEEYMRYCFIHSIFNGEHLEDINILDFEDISYNMDYKVFLHMCKCVKQEYDNFGEGEILFANMFDMDTDTEQRIINNYALAYITEQIIYDNLYIPIIKIYRNIFKIEAHKKKHSKLINLYTKLDIKNKQKKTISRILNNKFDTDIIQNIISAY